jgi:hypothetical protein
LYRLFAPVIDRTRTRRSARRRRRRPGTSCDTWRS